MESAVSNLTSPGEEVIVLNGGKFGERWLELVQAFGARPCEVKYPFGRGVEPDALDEALAKHPNAKVVFATQNESSTAVLNDIEALAKVTRERNRLLVVDAISSLGGTPLPMDAWGVDVVVAGSQKCLMLPPGLAFVGVSKRAWEKAEASRGHRYYFDWKQYQKAAKNAESPYTSAVSLMFALDESLSMLEEEGAEARFERHRLMRAMIRGRARGFGIHSVRGGSMGFAHADRGERRRSRPRRAAEGRPPQDRSDVHGGPGRAQRGDLSHRTHGRGDSPRHGDDARGD